MARNAFTTALQNIQAGGDQAPSMAGLDQRQALANMLISRGMDTQGIRSPWQVAGNVAQTLLGSYMMNQNQEAQRAQMQEQEQQRQALADTLRGATGVATAENAPARPGAPQGGTTQDRMRGVAKMLASNPQTAGAGLQLGLSQAQQEQARGSQPRVQTISGRDANRLFRGVNLPPEAAVTVESGPQGNRITDVREPAERPSRDVKAQFQAVDREGNRMTVLRTNEGLFTQTVDEEGNPRMVPVDSRRIRPVSTQEAGTSSELSGLGSTEARNLRNAEVATRNFTATAADAIELLENSPDVNTFMGRAASFVNDMQTEASAFARNMGLEIETGALDPSTYSEDFDSLGIKNQRMRSLVTSLAFQAAAASGQTGRSVSNRDVQRFIQEVGAQSSDPRAFKQTLADVARRTVRNYKTNVSVRAGQEPQGDFGLDRINGLLNVDIGEPSVEFTDEDQALIDKYSE